MPSWGSDDIDSLDIKPVIAPDGSVSNSHQHDDGKAQCPSLELCPSSQATTLQEDCAFAGKSRLSTSCGASNGPSAAESSKSNGPHPLSISPSPTEQLIEHQRLTGISNISVLPQRPTRPRSGTPPTATVLPNHVMKTESTMASALCAQRLPVPTATPNSCVGPDLSITLSRKPVQPGPLSQHDSRPVGSPLSGTRALTPPQAVSIDLTSAAPGASRLGAAAPTAGELVYSNDLF